MQLSADTLSIAQMKQIAEGAVNPPSVIPLEYIPIILGALVIGVVVVMKKRKGKKRG